MFERFTKQARLVVVRACAEAERLGAERIGPEHMLLALSEGPGATVLAGIGADEAGLRAALAEPPRDPIDRDALAAIGIDLDEVRRRAEAAFGPGALARGGRGAQRGRLPFAAEAKRALERSLREAVALGDRRLEPDHLLLGVAGESEGRSADALRRCGTSPGALRAAVLAARRRDAA